MSGDGGDSYDKEYNERMAAIAEQYAGYAGDAFNSWYSGGARELEEATANAGLGLLPVQTQLASGQIDSMLSLLPSQTALQQSQLNLGIQKTGNQSAIMDKFYSAIGNTDPALEASRAAADMSTAFRDSKTADTMNQKRMGLYGPTTNKGLSLDEAKAIAGAKYTARTNANNQNISQLYQGLTL